MFNFTGEKISFSIKIFMLMNRFYTKAVALAICALSAAPSMWAAIYEAPGGITYNIYESSGTAEFARLTVQSDFNISELEIPDAIDYNGSSYKVVGIGDNACYLNNYLTKVVIGKNVTQIASGAFYSCVNIASIEFPAGLDFIGTQAFYGCKALTELNLPSSVTAIGSFAFYNNESLTSITIPASLNRIGDNPFGGCTGVSSYTLAEGNTTFTVEDGVLFDKNKTELISYPAGKTSQTYVLPSTVKKIGGNSMRNNAYLQNVVFPETLEEIGAGALNVCHLTSVNIPASVTVIGERAFTSNPYLTEFIVAPGNPNYSAINKHLCTKDGKTLICGVGAYSITIPETVETLENYAFYQQNSIRTINLNNVKKVGRATFYRCSQLNSVDFGSALESIGRDAFMYCSSLASVILPSSTREIGDQAFLQCQSMSQLKLNEGLDSIGSSAFLVCFGLSQVTIPGTLRKAGSGIFASSPMMTSAVFSEGLETIPYAIFNNCSRLSSVTLPSTLKRIENSAFNGASALTSVDLPEGLESIGQAAFQFAGLTDVKLPNSVREIESGAFGYCRSMKSFETGSGLKIIHDYAVGACDVLETIKLNEGLESIGKASLAYSNALRSIAIPSTVTTIGEGAFIGNKAMKVIYNLATTPQALSTDILEKPERYEEVRLSVPAASVSAYKSAPIWQKFTSITATSGIAGVESDGVSVVEIYDVNGVRHQQPVRGINIYRMSDGSVKKVLVAD